MWPFVEASCGARPVVTREGMLEVLSCVAVWIPRRWTLEWLRVMVFRLTVGVLRQALAQVPRGWQWREAWGACAGSIRL